MNCHTTHCKFVPNADRTQYSGVTNMRRYYNDCCGMHDADIHVDFISVDENNPYIKCGYCPFGGYN